MRLIAPTFACLFVVTASLDAAYSASLQKRRVAAVVKPAQTPLLSPEKFVPKGALPGEAAPGAGVAVHGAREAETGFDGLTNGLLEQGPRFDMLTADNVVPRRSYNDNRFLFEEVETVADGLGPTYNGQSCRECHQNVVTGGASQVMELRTGRSENGRFFESPGGTLLHSRASHPDIVERVRDDDTVQTFRVSTNTLGSGYVEAIANATLLAVRDAQPEAMRGTAVLVPVLEAGSAPRIGRFGWKSQHASLESFAADAYLNEMGITNPLFPQENTSADRWVGPGSGFDTVGEPEDDGTDTLAFADFMRATKAPSRGRITDEVRAGEAVFESIGCGTCHTPAMRTAPAGTKINGGTLTVHRALGDRVVRAYSDFLLHDVGTGDGIPVQATPEYESTANQIRTAPLWALRTRNRLMHDGLSLTRQDAIRRHAGQAAPVTARFLALDATRRRQLLAFLDSL